MFRINSVNLFFFFFFFLFPFEESKIYVDPYWGGTFRKKMSTALRRLFPIFSYNCKRLTKIRINNDGQRFIGFLNK